MDVGGWRVHMAISGACQSAIKLSLDKQRFWEYFVRFVWGLLGFCSELLSAAEHRRGGDFTTAPWMQPARYVGFFICTWKISLDNGPLIYSQKYVGGGRSISLTCADLCHAVLLKNYCSPERDEMEPRGKQSRAGLHPGSKLGMLYFPTMLSCLPPLLRTALPWRLPQWLQWVLETGWADCSQRSYFYSSHCPRVWPVFPSLQLSLPWHARDVKSRTSPNMHLAACVCISPAGRAVGVVCIDCWPFEMLALPIAWIFYKY